MDFVCLPAGCMVFLKFLGFASVFVIRLSIHNYNNIHMIMHELNTTSSPVVRFLQGP